MSRCKDSQIIIGSAAVYTARSTFSFFDICILYKDHFR